MNWTTFKFCYNVDFQRLRPHILAVEAFKEPALAPVLPLWWRAQSREFEASDTTHHRLSETELSRPLGLQTLTAKQQLRIKKVSRALAWARERFEPGGAPLSLEDIFAMHRLVSAGYASAGTPRVTSVDVGRQGVGGIHQGAPPERLQNLLNEYVQFVNHKDSRSRHPAVRALAAHFFFVALHPFSDGNGRVARLLQAAVLFSCGYNIHGGYGLSRFFYENRDRYETLLYRCLQRCPFDLTPFVAFGLEGLVIELQSLGSFLRTKSHYFTGRGRRRPSKSEERGRSKDSASSVGAAPYERAMGRRASRH